jgi:hypothetical protein
MPETRDTSSVRELVGNIRQGMVPRSVRLFAAQGLLPVSREELVRVLVLLVNDGDEEISQAARVSIGDFGTEVLVSTLQVEQLDPLEIDLLARCREDETLWGEVVRHSATADQTLRWLARTAPPMTQGSIITNQTRIMSCLEVLEDLRANPNVSQDVLRRVREFEEEFLQKAIVWATAEELAPKVEQGPSIEEALAQLRAIGMLIPGMDGLEGEASIPEPEPEAPPEIRDAFMRVTLMTTFQKIMTALKGTREERLILVRDRSALVVRAVINSPKMSEMDIELLSANRSANPEAFRVISSKPRWLRRYGTLRALCFNPKVPQAVVLQLFRRLHDRDMRMLAKDRGIPDAVRKVARDEVMRRG